MKARNIYLTKVALAFTFSLLITLLLMSPALASDSSAENNGQDEPYRIESFEMSGPGNLDVKTSGGHITVEGSSSNNVRVEMYVRKNGRNLLPEDTDLDDWDIEISQSGNTVEATAKRNKSNGFWGGNNMSISFKVFAPREMSSDLKTSGGHIKARGLSGNQEISTSGGHLELTNLKGNIEARTSGGHITLGDVQ